MPKFNMTKFAKVTGYKNYNRMLEELREDQDLSSETADRNINLSMPIKDADNTVPFEKQLEAARKDENTLIITEKSLNDAPKLFLDRRIEEGDTDIMPINLVSESYDQAKTKAFKEAEENDKMDTTFWDKYIGVQLEEEKTKVDNNVKNTQLENDPERFSAKKEPETIDQAEYNKIVEAKLKDADAMLFHIYAQASLQKRDLTTGEQQMVRDINIGKSHILSQQLAIPPIYSKEDETYVVQQNGEFIVYNREGKELWRSWDEQEILNQYPDAQKEY